ncbi:hypothetical protein BH20VER1_BH20VER1_26420 [soil metagenome]
MTADTQLDRGATAAVEEVLRVIYGDDLQGCSVSLESVARVIRSAFEEHATVDAEVAELHAKAFEAVQLLATPPANGSTLSPEDLRSLLSERLDRIRDLATKVLGTTGPQQPRNGHTANEP